MIRTIFVSCCALVPLFAAGCTKSTPSVAAKPIDLPAPGVEPADIDPDLQRVAWLTGVWVCESEGLRTEECWLAPRAGRMMGMSHAVRGHRRGSFEFIRIEKRGKDLMYLASPGGRHPPTPFRLVESTADRLIFENPQHDFPQRVVYERPTVEGQPDGKTLVARIQGVLQGQPQSQEWTYRRSSL